jgi:hypothetical protein
MIYMQNNEGLKQCKNCGEWKPKREIGDLEKLEIEDICAWCAFKIQAEADYTLERTYSDLDEWHM